MRRAALLLLLPLLAAAAPPEGDRTGERALMALTVANMAETSGASATRSLDPKVLEAMRDVPRHLFVPAEVAPLAYHNVPLPIGHEQTISQPYIVALMTHLLDVAPGHRVLEVGTGSGYQAALLSRLTGEVRTIEIVEPLAKEAAERLRRLGYRNVAVKAGDGYLGWPEHGPFDRIMVTAGAAHVPRPLLDQLKPGGRLVIPMSRGRDGEILTLVEKDQEGRVHSRDILPVRFVPLTRVPSPRRRGG
jgi:protein-L-isoaspartate(D-aspartate) O-methyltransferase